MPKFIVSFAGSYFPTMKVQYKDKLLSFEEYKMPIESVHIFGKKDEFLQYLNEEQLYDKNPIVIVHEENHKFPRALYQEDFIKLKNFVSRHYKQKFGDEVECDIPFEKYEF